MTSDQHKEIEWAISALEASLYAKWQAESVVAEQRRKLAKVMWGAVEQSVEPKPEPPR